jgi:hypothetical protein
VCRVFVAIDRRLSKREANATAPKFADALLVLAEHSRTERRRATQHDQRARLSECFLHSDERSALIASTDEPAHPTQPRIRICSMVVAAVADIANCPWPGFIEQHQLLGWVRVNDQHELVLTPPTFEAFHRWAQTLPGWIDLKTGERAVQWREKPS